MDMDVIERIQERVDELLDEYNGFKGTLDEAQEWNSLTEIITNIGTLTDFVIDVVLAVELSAREISDEFESITGAEKREAAAQLLDDLLDLPWYLEVIDGPAFELLLSVVVEMLNKYMGHDWNLGFMREALASGLSFIQIFKRERGLE